MGALARKPHHATLTMRFEHLIEINDSRLPISTITREQLWRGLVRRAEQPSEFVLGLNGATIHTRTTLQGDQLELRRTLDFGAFEVHDRVVLTPGKRTEIHTEPSEKFPASRMSISIEERGPKELYLRFIYESAVADGTSELDAMTVALRNEAYRTADVDTVRRIRRLAEEGALD